MKTWRDIPGWFDFEALYHAQVERVEKPARFVEVGSWLGRSTAFLAECIATSAKPIRLYAVDHGLGSYTAEQETFRYWLQQGGGTSLGLLHRFLLECGVADKVVILGTTSARAAELFAPESLDFVFIDGDHKYASVMEDLDCWWPAVKLGGVLAGHDYTTFASVTKAIHDRFGDGDWRSRASPSCWEITKT